jgi:hypothetical protein
MDAAVSPILSLLLVTAVGSVVPAVLYLAPGGDHAASWGARPLAERRVGVGAYRSAARTRWASRRAPWIVRIAALSCFYLGQLGPPAGVVGVAALLVGLQATTDGIATRLGHWPDAVPPVYVVVLGACLGAVWVGLCLLSAGWNLLVRDATASDKARRAARWSMGYGAALLAGVAVAWRIDPREPGIALFVVGLAVVTLLQAALLPLAARAIDALAHAPMPPPGATRGD